VYEADPDLKEPGDGIPWILIRLSHAESSGDAARLIRQPCQTRSTFSGDRRGRPIIRTPLPIDINKPATAKTRMADSIIEEMAMAIAD
jgi:hypothetical protein